MPSPFTLPTPRPLEAERRGEHWYVEVGGRRVRLSHLDKVWWPEEGYTKGDLLAYYSNVADTLLPHIRERPLTMHRMPDGLGGPSFYEKNAPSHTPNWVPRCPVPSEEGGVIDYLMVADAASLLFVVNLGCIELHPLHSRCRHLEAPDYLFFDLDPFEPATFEDVLAVARHVHAALSALGVESYPKTSGATGMQIFVPLDPPLPYEDIRRFVYAVARIIRDADPSRVTLESRVKDRAGRVYIDYNMNRAGANIAAVYSVRPEPGATVSMPVSWEEVAAASLRPQDFTIVTAHERLERAGDLFRGVLERPVDVRAAMERLGLPPSTPLPPAAPSTDDRLLTYGKRRDFASTPEPPPRHHPEAGRRFVVQKHAARRLHYDLRLEHDGVLVSWAVPKGLPTEAGERRLAIRTEDHPIDYLDFEGWIPPGQYGAGEMRIFDRGTYEPLEWKEGKITVRLEGQRLRGEYHLVKTSGDWLIFRSRSSAPLAPPPSLLPMMAATAREPFDDPAFSFEPKLDGVRTLAYVRTDGTRLVSRTGRDQTASYPELAHLATYVNAVQAVLDGEIVVQDETGRPCFELLQQRMGLQPGPELERARERHPVRLYLFDVLWIDDTSLLASPFSERRRLLHEITTEAGPVALTYGVDGEGRSFFEAVRRLGIEGVVAKALDSPYRPGTRSRSWLKIKATKTLDVVVVGFTPGTGSRASTLGALLLGGYDALGHLRFAGSVGTGMSAATLEDLRRRLESLEIPEPATDDPELRRVRGARFVRPKLVCEVEYLEMTRAGRLRAPCFVRLRDDKAPTDCVLGGPSS